jgi:methyl-accepting chemotaxis protein
MTGQDSSQIYGRLAELMGEIRGISRQLDDLSRAFERQSDEDKQLGNRIIKQVDELTEVSVDVQRLSEIAERGRWAFKGAIWIGGTIIAVMTAVAQLRSVLTHWWTQN